MHSWHRCGSKQSGHFISCSISAFWQIIEKWMHKEIKQCLYVFIVQLWTLDTITSPPDNVVLQLVLLCVECSKWSLTSLLIYTQAEIEMTRDPVFSLTCIACCHYQISLLVNPGLLHTVQNLSSKSRQCVRAQIGLLQKHVMSVTWTCYVAQIELWHFFCSVCWCGTVEQAVDFTLDIFSSQTGVMWCELIIFLFHYNIAQCS